MNKNVMALAMALIACVVMLGVVTAQAATYHDAAGNPTSTPPTTTPPLPETLTVPQEFDAAGNKVKAK
jgi:hypothetical protein